MPSRDLYPEQLGEIISERAAALSLFQEKIPKFSILLKKYEVLCIQK